MLKKTCVRLLSSIVLFTCTSCATLFQGVVVLVLILLSNGCSVVMESTRPTPVDTSQFVVGESHLQIVEVLGAPTATIKQGDQSCDVYKLYTHGPGGVGKGAIAA